MAGAGPPAVDAPQGFGLGIAPLAQSCDPVVVGVDLLGEGGDGFEQGQQCWAERLGDGGGSLVGEAVSGAGRQASPGALGDRADVVDEQGAGTNQSVTRAGG